MGSHTFKEGDELACLLKHGNRSRERRLWNRVRVVELVPPQKQAVTQKGCAKERYRIEMCPLRTGVPKLAQTNVVVDLVLEGELVPAHVCGLQGRQVGDVFLQHIRSWKTPDNREFDPFLQWKIKEVKTEYVPCKVVENFYYIVEKTDEGLPSDGELYVVLQDHILRYWDPSEHAPTPWQREDGVPKELRTEHPRCH
jgi:hypothetical protein